MRAFPVIRMFPSTFSVLVTSSAVIATPGTLVEATEAAVAMEVVEVEVVARVAVWRR